MKLSLLLVPLLSVWLSACVGVAPQGGEVPAGASFDAAAEENPDPALAADRPQPGGVSAPVAEWEGDGKFYTAQRGTVSRCTEEVHLANGTDKTIIKTRLHGRIVRVDKEDGSELGPAFACFGHYARITEGEGDSLTCTDAMLKPDCTFEKDIEIGNPGAVTFYRSEQVIIINLNDPEPHSACEPAAVASEFEPLLNEFDFSGMYAEAIPPCARESRRGEARPLRSIHAKIKDTLE